MYNQLKLLIYKKKTSDLFIWKKSCTYVPRGPESASNQELANNSPNPIF
jgi:hypothetical protein